MDGLAQHLMAEHRDGGFADGQAMLREQVGDGFIRGPLAAQFRDPIFCRQQFVELRRTFGRKLRDCFLDVFGIKHGS